MDALCGVFPGQGGLRIATMEVGDRVAIFPGGGSPRSNELRDDVVVFVKDFAAVTASGIKLAYDDGRFVVKISSNVFTKISQKAKKAIDQLNGK